MSEVIGRLRSEPVEVRGDSTRYPPGERTYAACIKCGNEAVICCDQGFSHTDDPKVTKHIDPICTGCCKHDWKPQEGRGGYERGSEAP